MALTIREKNLLLSAIGDPEAAEAIADAIDEAGTVGTLDIEDLAVTTAKLALLNVTTGTLAANGVTDAKLRTSAALTVIGRGANSVGNVADIAAGTDGFVLRRSGITLAFGTIAPGAFAANAVETAAIAAGAVTSAKMEAGLLRFADVTVTSEEILALNTTPKQLVAAPGSDLVVIVDSVYATMTYAAATYAADAAGFTVRYTDGSGNSVGATLTEGFVESTASAMQSVRAAATALTPVANAAIVLYADNGNPTTGDSAIKVRTYYRVVPNPLA